MRSKLKQIALCTFGTMLEWYDFSLFAALAPIISQIFFPHANHYAAMMLTFVVFASGFIMRPIGAIFFGHFGDKYGRKTALVITVFLMTISTTAIGLIPAGTYFSTLLLVVFRLIQGFAASGEYPGGITLLAEQNFGNKKGFITSFGIFAAPAGIFIGTLICAVVSMLVSHDQLINWGWRIPFLLGAPLGLLGYQIRKSLFESAQFNKAKNEKSLVKVPLLYLIKNYYLEFGLALSLYILGNVSFYINFIYFSNYAADSHKLSTGSVLYLNAITTFVYASTIPLFGLFSDYISKKLLMICACVFMILLIYPLFTLILNSNLGSQLAAQSLISVMIGMFVGPLAIVSAELFPVQIRYTGVGMSLNIAAAIFGGTTPLVCSWLVEALNNPIAPAYYFISTAIFALLAVIFIKNKTCKPIF